MNDPNGLIHVPGAPDGAYHLFYQHNPQAPVWGNMTWGHAASDDLVHWRDLPHALEPSDRYDVDGCFSGCCVSDHGTPTIVYTGVAPGGVQTQCLATSHDGLRTWRKDIANPVLSDPPAGFGPGDFRDPFVWRDETVRGGRWLMVLGSCTTDGRGAALLYQSADLHRWDFIGPLHVAHDDTQGAVWECPNFFHLGTSPHDGWVLIVSLIPQGNVIYFTGTFDGRRFHPRLQGEFDAGSEFYAPLTLVDGHARRIAFGWLREGRRHEAQMAAGWSGAQSLPRLLSLGEDGALRYSVVDEVSTLRGERVAVIDRPIEADHVTPLHEAHGDALEITAEFEVGAAHAVGLAVRRTPDGEEETQIVYDAVGKRLMLDRTRASGDESVMRDVRMAALELAPHEALSLHVFVDRSVIEVIANGRVCVTTRVYPTRPDAMGLGLLARGGAAKLRRLECWAMRGVF